MEIWQKKVKLLQDAGLSIRIEKEGEIVFESADSMLRPLFICLTKMPEQIKDALVIDKIVGRAAALLCVLGKVREVYTPMASKSAQALLEEHGIELKANRITPQIMNRNNDGPCPMEKMACGFKNPEDFYQELAKRIKIEEPGSL